MTPPPVTLFPSLTIKTSMEVNYGYTSKRVSHMPDSQCIHVLQIVTILLKFILDKNTGVVLKHELQNYCDSDTRSKLRWRHR